ncbi:MAG: redox-sensing transcriptional repressor Rex [bacterium]|nr:redox-sensing transcriptional repressor Rex [bacterium]
MGRKKNKDIIPHEAIRRLSLYLRALKWLSRKKIKVVSSDEITKYLNTIPAQFRKDLSYFGGFGKRGVGYNVEALIREIEKILGTNMVWDIALIGAGKLGTALLGYAGFMEFNLKIAIAFDNDRSKAGRVFGNIRIEPISRMKKEIREKKIKIALLTVPAQYAQKISEDLVQCGIKAILNFAPVNLHLANDIHVAHVDMASELGSLVYRLKHKSSHK